MRHSSFVLAWVLVIGGCASDTMNAPLDPAAAMASAALRARAAPVFRSLPEVADDPVNPITPERVALGRALFHDTRLSKSRDLACASCHALDGFGVDTRPAAMERGTSFGEAGQFGDRNAPSVYNAAFSFAQFWDGRASNVEEQAKGPVLNPIEMAMPDEASVVAVLNSIPGYAPLFAAAFPTDTPAISYDNMARAIGAFERKLVTPAPFDRFMAGEDAALGADQRAGLELFLNAGCASCHEGPGVGGGMYQKLGLLKPYSVQDVGRYKITEREEDRFFFKVPALRNVTETGPFFHDGSIKSIDAAVRIMAVHQTPSAPLDDAQVRLLVAFLESLTGVPPADLIAAPQLPPG